MKKASTHTFLLALILTLSIAIEGCNNSNLKSYSASISSVEIEKPLAKKDLQFLYEASNLSIYNIQVANEALIRSTARETTTLAENIISSSSKTKNAIAIIAAKHSLNLPLDITLEQKRTWSQLVKQRGWNFDKAFAAIIETNSDNASDLFTNAIKECNDRSLKDIATKGLTAQENIKEYSIAQENKIKERTGIVEEPANANGAVAELIKIKQKN